MRASRRRKDAHVRIPCPFAHPLVRRVQERQSLARRPRSSKHLRTQERRLRVRAIMQREQGPRECAQGEQVSHDLELQIRVQRRIRLACAQLFVGDRSSDEARREPCGTLGGCACILHICRALSAQCEHGHGRRCIACGETHHALDERAFRFIRDLGGRGAMTEDRD